MSGYADFHSARKRWYSALGGDKAADRTEHVDRSTQRARKRNGRPNKQTPVKEPDHRHSRGIREAVKRSDWTVSYPDLRSKLQQRLAHTIIARVVREIWRLQSSRSSHGQTLSLRRMSDFDPSALAYHAYLLNLTRTTPFPYRREPPPKSAAIRA